MAKTLTLNSERPDFENGAVGTQNDARLALFNQIADGVEAAHADEFEDVTDDMYANPTGTGDMDEGEYREPARAADDGDADADAIEDAPAPESGALPRIKVNGHEIELTPELIARTQKIAAADEYLAQASRLYKTASTASEPSSDVPPVDDIALARAIQLGSEEEAVAAIQKLRTLPPGEIDAIIEAKLAKRDTQSDAERFKSQYKDLLADSAAQEAVWAFDTLYANDGEAPTYERFEKAAKQVMKLRGDVTGLESKQERKDNARRPVIGQSARPAPRPQEREPTVQEEIAAMAKARGQAVYSAGA